MSDAIRQAIEELRYLTGCRCDARGTDRGLHETHCAYEYREDVETIVEALTFDAEDPCTCGHAHHRHDMGHGCIECRCGGFSS